MNSVIIKFLTLLILINDAFLVEGAIRACHLNNANTTFCYRENLDGMLKILKRARNKPDPMFMDDISFEELYGEDGVAKVAMSKVQLHNVLNAEVDDIKTIYNQEERTFDIEAVIKLPNVDLICALDLQIECDEDKICTGVREFFSSGELQINFSKIFLQAILKFKIEILENRKVLEPLSSKSALIFPEKGLPPMNFKSYKNNQLENILVKRMFSDYWGKLLAGMTENEAYLKPYDEHFVKRTQKYFNKLTVYE